MLTAQLYHLLTHNLNFDHHWYEEHITPNNGPILELGVGTGRILLPLARKGFACFGIDNNAEMIDFCREQVQKEQISVSLHQQEMQDFSLHTQFQQIHVPLRSIQLLSADERKLVLRQIQDHLQPNGHAIFHISLFSPQTNSAWTLYRTVPSSDGGYIVIDECSQFINNNLLLLHRFQQISPQHMVTGTYMLQHLLHPITSFEEELSEIGLKPQVIHTKDSDIVIMAVRS